MEKREINLLPMTTFRWTKSNSSDLFVSRKYADNRIIPKWSGDISLVTEVDSLQIYVDDILSTSFRGADQETFQRTLETGTPQYLIKVAAGEQATLGLELQVETEQTDWLAGIVVILDANAKLDFLISICGNTAYQGQINYSMISNLQENSQLKVTKIHCGRTTNTALEHRYTKIADKAEAIFLNAEFGAKQFVYHGEADLCGNAAKVSEECVYVADGGEHVDIYYDRNHYGKRTESHLATFGALLGNGKKVFRGCINFKKGASGSVGNEEDYAMMLSPNAKNVSLPLLLCTEDDVQGNHATSAGQVEKERLFYLMSRGFSLMEAKRILVESMLRPIVDKIEREDLREAVLSEISQKMGKLK